MQLVIHAPFGARINRAWGLALRKKFCRTFDFELQAAATDDAILLSIGPQHSFPLDAIFGFVTPPPSRRRWCRRRCSRRCGRRAGAGTRRARSRSCATPAAAARRRRCLRMRAADLMAAVFPDAAGCQDNHGGVMREDMALPDHPLVPRPCATACRRRWTPTGSRACSSASTRATIKYVARDTVAPSPWAHAILERDAVHVPRRRAARGAPLARGADDAPGELARATSASSTRDAIRAVVAEAEPDPRDADELHDLLCTAIALAPRGAWRAWYEELVATGRAATLHANGTVVWVATERRAVAEGAYGDDDVATTALVGGFMLTAGPQTAAQIAAALELPTERVDIGWRASKPTAACCRAASPLRTFRPECPMKFGPHTCFVLTDAGVQLFRGRHLSAAAVADGHLRHDQPHTHAAIAVPNANMDPHSREFSAGRQSCAKTVYPAGPGLYLVLSSFQELNWPPRMDDPLPPAKNIVSAERLRDTVRRLNRCQDTHTVRFSSDGMGTGIRWKWIPSTATNHG